MTIREAHTHDIPQLQVVRNSVTENTLSDPSLATDDDYRDYLTRRGKGWVCEVNEKIIGFAIADLEAKNIWALFITPGYERRGIGRKLHETLLNWYFSQTQDTVWLSTSPHTRAEMFYRKAGWTETGPYGKGEIRFEMTYANWMQLRSVFSETH